MASVSCYACGATYEGVERKRCACGEPTWVDVDASTFDWDRVRNASSIWRYADVLPVEPADDLSAAAGGTPLIRTKRLDADAGCRLHVKDEGENPTGSFKDRGSAVGVTWAAAAGREWVGTVSHGNMAMSTSAHAASRGLGCVVLVPARIPPGRLAAIAQYDPTVLRVEGDYGRLYFETLDAATDPAIEFVNSDAPLRVEGQKTTAYEILEAFAPDVPDAVVLPVSSGGHASATWKAFRELADAGVVDEPPRLYLVQAAAVDPIARAFERGDDRVREVPPRETVAFSISNGSPPSGNRALAAARATDGGVVSVSEDAIREATSALAARAGISAEPASATVLAAVRRLSADGAVGRDEDVVAVVTGTGFKELDAAAVESDATDVTLEDLDGALAAAVDRS